MLDFRQAKLTDIAAWYDVTPISEADLAVHKATELAKHPAHPLYRYLRRMPQPPLMMMIGVFVSSCAGVVVTGLLAIICAGAAVLFFIGLLVSAFHQNYRVYGPATWVEQHLTTDCLCHLGVPQPIAEIAETILNSGHADDAHLVYGKLTRQSFLLDPYLAIERDGERIIIGIWDGHQIIQQATINPR